MNAKEELNNISTDIKCVQIRHEPCIVDFTNHEDFKENIKYFNLKENHTSYEFKLFMNSLNFEYDEGYGGQQLFGTIWLNSGEWLTRGEYDGSEWWELHKQPEIPEILK